MLVNVLVTFYNQEKFVNSAIKSVIEQKTSFAFKIIVGDDGSTDGTVEKIKYWMDLYPDKIELYIWSHEKNDPKGFRASQNRLNLLKCVDSKYFIFLDGDDYYTDKNKLQRQVEILEDPNNWDCVACAHNIATLNNNNILENITTEEIKEGKYDVTKYWGSLYFHTNTLLIKSEVITKLPISLLENNFNDILITFSVIQQGAIYYIPKSMAVYRLTGEGIWTSGNQVINHIRNMFLYDIANIINPGVKNITNNAMAFNWHSIVKIRHEINTDLLCEYELEARDKNLINSLKWIRYNKLNYFEKVCLLNQTFEITRGLVEWEYKLQDKKQKRGIKFVNGNSNFGRFKYNLFLKLFALNEMRKNRRNKYDIYD